MQFAKWVGVEHREEAHEEIQRHVTDENANSEDQKHSSGGVFVAMFSNLGVVVDTEEGAVESTTGNEGRIVQVWVNVRGVCGSSRCTFGTRRVGPRGMRSCLRQWRSK